MAAVIDFLEFKSQSVTPTLVLVGLHQYLDGGGDFGAYSGMLANCRVLLARARAHNLPIAHVRSINPKGASDRLRYPQWIAGFEPVRSDMVFDLLQPSCYSNPEFSRTMEYSNGNFAIAGMFGETTCLSTAIDAHHRNHPFTYIADATACRSGGDVPAHQFHDVVSRLMSVYGTVTDGSRWTRLLPMRRDVS
jgi:nicotinamidase-related amidase